LMFRELSAQLLKSRSRLFDAAVGFLELGAAETLQRVGCRNIPAEGSSVAFEYDWVQGRSLARHALEMRASLAHFVSLNSWV